MSWEERVGELAKQHGIADVAGLREAMSRAMTASVLDYDADKRPDTLDEVDRLAGELLVLLDFDETNRQRIISALVDERESHPEIHDDYLVVHDDRVVDAAVDEFDAMLRMLGRLMFVARRAHRAGRGRGRPRKTEDLRGAYGWLASFYKRAFGEERFTQDWQKTETGLEPMSPAARFVLGAMKLIDPRRPRLAEELRAVMIEDIHGTLGHRRGREVKQIRPKRPE